MQCGKENISGNIAAGKGIENMKKDKLKSLDLRYFLVPFSILLILFSIMTFTAINKRVSQKYLSFEQEAINIAEGYSHALVYSHDAHKIVTELLEEKLILALQAISMIENKYDNELLSRIGEQFFIDEIYLYNDNAEIIHSKDGKYIGWKAQEGHPVYNFFKSNERILVEEIRKDSDSDNYLKYAYLKNDDGTFIQIGIKADTVRSFLQRFEFNKLMEELAGRNGIISVMYINNNFEIAASSSPELIGEILTDEVLIDRISQGRIYSSKTTFNDQDAFQGYVPILHEGRVSGVLSIVWSMDEVKAEIKEMVTDGVIAFSVVIFVMSIILYYAYIINKSNIRIAYYDKLTGLPNHEYLFEHLDNEIKNMGNKKKAIFLLNCRNFETLNMTYGFNYGNEILIQIANRVKGIIDPNDRFFRFNADRFVLTIDNYIDRDQLTDIAHRILEIFEHPIMGSVENQYINAEISIVEIHDKGITVDKLLQDAVLALDNLDKNSNEQICFYQDVMEEQIIRQDRIARALRAIIENEEDEQSRLYLHFQPKWCLKNNRLIGFECLSRLYVNELGNIPPIEFIDIAEKRWFIYDLGKLILQKACRFLSKIYDLGFDDIKISVNISVIQLLRDEFVKDLIEIIESSGIDKKSLILEITESIIMENFDLINKKLEKIRRTGILISLDDFGTGFSSLSRLRELNIDYVKIDKYFIDNIREGNDDTLITADIISMSHKVGLKVVAEGVEREDQKKYLERNQCDILQGYLISKPLNEDKAIDFLKNKSIGL